MSSTWPSSRVARTAATSHPLRLAERSLLGYMEPIALVQNATLMPCQSLSLSQVGDYRCAEVGYASMHGGLNGKRAIQVLPLAHGASSLEASGVAGQTEAKADFFHI